ncbi:MAG: hypothetical protein M1829_002540 [Trizodia sp. TS-e1964]|nr:MAG: hypothetical protein M1829_002540 [Trizodia sp. TS-e1964]
MPAPSNWDLPQLVTTVTIKQEQQKRENTCENRVYGVQFYPYTEPGEDPVFATTGGKETLICRPTLEETGVEVLRCFRDDDPMEELSNLAWTKDPETGDPWLCVAGIAATIKVLNIKTGEYVRTLVGHGKKEITEIAVSPLSPLLLASASEDTSVRIWSLDSAFEKQPCAVIAAGNGHQEMVLTIAFHESGRYLLSGGMDNMVNLWMIPDLPNESTGTDRPTLIHFPHFATTSLHNDYVDCVKFHHDLILSKAAKEEKIVLWRIEGFSSSLPPPAPESAPSAYEWHETRSAFGGGFERLLQFATPGTNPFFMHFGLFSQPNKHPVLAMGNQRGNVYFWDLQRLEHWPATADLTDLPFLAPEAQKKRYLSALRERSVASATSGSILDTADGAAAAAGPLDLKAARRDKRYDVSDPFGLLKAHHTVRIPRSEHFLIRQAAWSVGAIDLTALYPSHLTPAFMISLREYYVATYHDRNFVAPTAWFCLYVWMEALYHLPLSVYAIGALLRDDPKAPLHLLIFAVQAGLTTATCIAYYLSWDITSAQKYQLGLLYVPYLALGKCCPDLFRAM